MELESKAFFAEKVKTKAYFFQCPFCKAENEIITIQIGFSRCLNCNTIIAQSDKELVKITVEKEVDGYVCPLCKETVADTPSNHTGQETTNGKPAVLCPRCRCFLNGLPLIHHGQISGEFKPVEEGIDYFGFRHKPCFTEKHGGFCIIYAVLIDNQGRIVFNLQCWDCGKVDALKTHTYFLAKDKASIEDHTVEYIYLSSNLSKRIAKHGWNNL